MDSQAGPRLQQKLNGLQQGESPRLELDESEDSSEESSGDAEERQAEYEFEPEPETELAATSTPRPAKTAAAPAKDEQHAEPETDASAGTHDPFASTVVDDRLDGRGASAMKSGLAGSSVAVRDLLRPGRPGEPLRDVTIHTLFRDEYDPATWSCEGITADVQVLYQLGFELANSREWPNYLPSSEFRPIRDRTAGARK